MFIHILQIGKSHNVHLCLRNHAQIDCYGCAEMGQGATDAQLGGKLVTSSSIISTKISMAVLDSGTKPFDVMDEPWLGQCKAKQFY